MLTDEAEREGVNMSRTPSGARLADLDRPSQQAGKRKADFRNDSAEQSEVDGSHKAQRRKIDNSLYLETRTGKAAGCYSCTLSKNCKVFSLETEVDCFLTQVA